VGLLYALFLVTSLFDPPPADLNTADSSRLASIPGLGPSKAAAIINYRESVSPFLSVDELTHVPGIGPGTLESVASFVTVTPVEEVHGTDHLLVLEEPADTVLTVVFLDVGNGDAILLESRGHSLLIDGGPPGDPGMRAPVVQRLREAGVESIDAVMFTHPHADHIGGLADVLTVFGAGLLLDPGIDHPSPVYEHLLETALHEGCAYDIFEEGRTISLGQDLSIEVVRLERSLSVNEASAVFMVKTGHFSMLVTGDIEEETIRMITMRATPVTVLKVPHHGSRSSLFPPWSRRVAPMVAVFCVGRDNPFGHPHPAVTADWASTGAVVLRTDILGNIFLRTDGTSLSIQNSREAL
jgi:competence protein ComEC